MVENSKRPISVNPIKLSQPMGAALAFLGVDGCMPLMHGAQGCANFTRTFYSRHYRDPIVIQTTAVNDITAIFDGGEFSISEAIKTITERVTPELIGLFTTGLTETKGDDIKGIAPKIEFPVVAVNTPDFEGGFESGWARAVEGMIQTLTEISLTTDPTKAVLLPHVGMNAYEVETLKTFIGSFGFSLVEALPDISTVLDGHLSEEQGQIAKGGITITSIRNLASAGIVVAIGASMQNAAALLCTKNPSIKILSVNHLGGMEATDYFVKCLMELTGKSPEIIIQNWRSRLADMLLDSHFILGKCRIALAGDPDTLSSQAAILTEVGVELTCIVATTYSPVLDTIKSTKIVIGDLRNLYEESDMYDLIITNTHGEAMARDLSKAIVIRGFPNWERLGVSLSCDLLYEGSTRFLAETGNELIKHKCT